MTNVIQYTSKGEFVKVLLKNGGSYSDVIICPDPLDPYSRKHIIERTNGDAEFIQTKEIKGIMYI